MKIHVRYIKPKQILIPNPRHRAYEEQTLDTERTESHPNTPLASHPQTHHVPTTAERERDEISGGSRPETHPRGGVEGCRAPRRGRGPRSTRPSPLLPPEPPPPSPAPRQRRVAAATLRRGNSSCGGCSGRRGRRPRAAERKGSCRGRTTRFSPLRFPIPMRLAAAALRCAEEAKRCPSAREEDTGGFAHASGFFSAASDMRCGAARRGRWWVRQRVVAVRAGSCGQGYGKVRDARERMNPVG
jgi:hypothetical protein